MVKGGTSINQSSGGRNTKQRMLLLQLLKAKRAPIAAPDLLKLAQSKIPNLNKTTVYRTLERLVGEHLVTPVMLTAGTVHYELADATHHHHHFICNDCTKIYCLDGCPAELKNLIPKGFVMTGHEVTLRGICADCR